MNFARSSSRSRGTNESQNLSLVRAAHAARTAQQPLHVARDAMSDEAKRWFGSPHWCGAFLEGVEIMRRLATLGASIALLVGAATASGDTTGRGEGGIVIADDVPIYSSSDGNKKIATCVKGDVVAAIASLLAGEFVFSEKHGRVQVKFFPNMEQVGIPWDGWIDPKQLSKFSYDCSCSVNEGCNPTPDLLTYPPRRCPVEPLVTALEGLGRRGCGMARA